MSTGFRITTKSASRSVLDNLQGSLGRVQKLQEQLSSGKAVQRPSDDPANALAAMQHRAGIRRTDQYARNADDGLGWLGTADDALTSVSDVVRRVRDLSLQGANASYSPQDRAAIAAEVLSLRDGLVQIANARYLDRPVFGGTSGSPVAFSQGTGGVVTFSGNTQAVSRTVAAATQVPVSIDGVSIFGADGANIFDTMTQIAADLTSGNTAALSGADLTALDTHRNRISEAHSTIGARYNRVEVMQSRAYATTDSLTAALSDVEDVDLPKTIMELQLQQTGYQAALAAASKSIQPSLVDFLR